MLDLSKAHGEALVGFMDGERSNNLTAGEREAIRYAIDVFEGTIELPIVQGALDAQAKVELELFEERRAHAATKDNVLYYTAMVRGCGRCSPLVSVSVVPDPDSGMTVPRR